MRRQALVLALAFATLSAPRAHAECTSTLPVSDPRAASVACSGAGVGMGLLVPSLKWGPDWSCAASYAFGDQYGNKYLTFPGSCYLDYHCLEDEAVDALPPPLNQILPGVLPCLDRGESESEPTFRNNGPIVTDYAHRRIGRIVYAVMKDEVDFALLRVDRNVKLDQSVPFYGGPTRIGVAGAQEEGRVYSPTFDPIPNARAGLIRGNADDAWVVTQDALSTAGSTVQRTNGEAIGFFTGENYIGSGDRTQPLAEGIARAQRHTGLRLRLLTAPLK